MGGTPACIGLVANPGSCHWAGEAALTGPSATSWGLLRVGAIQGLAPELVTPGRKEESFLFFTVLPVVLKVLSLVEPESLRDTGFRCPQPLSGQVSRAPPLSLECQSGLRPTPQSQPQSSQAESSLSLGWGGNRMWGGRPHPSCLGGVSSSLLPSPLVSWLEQA